MSRVPTLEFPYLSCHLSRLTCSVAKLEVADSMPVHCGRISMRAQFNSTRAHRYSSTLKNTRMLYVVFHLGMHRNTWFWHVKSHEFLLTTLDFAPIPWHGAAINASIKPQSKIKKLYASNTGGGTRHQHRCFALSSPLPPPFAKALR